MKVQLEVRPDVANLLIDYAVRNRLYNRPNPNKDWATNEEREAVRAVIYDLVDKFVKEGGNAR
jgi:hypothetical protein